MLVISAEQFSRLEQRRREAFFHRLRSDVLVWFVPNQVSQIVVKNATVAVAGLVRTQSGVADRCQKCDSGGGWSGACPIRCRRSLSKMRQWRWLVWCVPDQVSQIVVKNATVAVAGLVRTQSGVADRCQKCDSGGGWSGACPIRCRRSLSKMRQWR